MIHFKIKHRVIPGFDQGWGNGYVLLPKGHKYHGISYDEIDLDVHGGLTYSEHISKDFLKRSDLTDDEIEQIDLDSWCIGFDTAHYGDNEHNCPESYVENQCLHLKSQLGKKNLHQLIKQVLKNE
jgi:hypothetical protein